MRQRHKGIIIASAGALIALGWSSWLAQKQSLRLDEAQSIWVATKPELTILKTVSQDVHVPLYMLLLRWWMQVRGTEPAAARELSLIFFGLSLIPLYKLAEEAADSTTAGLTVGLFCLSPFVVWYASEARMYTLFALAAILAHLTFLRVYRSEAREGKLAYLAATVLGLYSHYFFIFLLLMQAAYLGWQINRKFWPLQALKFMIMIWAAAGGLFVPWAWLVIRQGLANAMQPLIAAPTSYNLLQTWAVFLFGWPGKGDQAAIVSFWPLLTALILWIFTKEKLNKGRQSGYFGWLTFGPIGLIFLISLVRPIFLTRYLIFTVPTFFYLIALTISSLKGKGQKILMLGLGGLMGGLLFWQSYKGGTAVTEDYRSLVEEISQQATPRDIIIVSAPFTVYPVEYYYRGNTRIETIPGWDRWERGPIPPFSEEGVKSQVEEYRQQYERMFVVLSYDQGYQASLEKWLDNNLERLEFKDFPAGIALKVYKLRYDR